MIDSDQYQTPQWLFDILNLHFNFTIDACANKCNTKCDLYLDNAQDEWINDGVFFRNGGYAVWEDNFPDWHHSVFMNPPYSKGNIDKCMTQAWEFSKYMRVVCLVRCDPSTDWFNHPVESTENTYTVDIHQRNTETITDAIHRYEKRSATKPYKHLGIITLRKRLKFEASEEMLEKDPKKFVRKGDVIECKDSYNFPVCLMIMDRRNEK